MSRLVSRTGNVETVHHYDEAENKAIIETRQDVEKTLEYASFLRKHNPKGYTKSGEYKMIASIPRVFFNQWLKENPHLWQDEKDLKRRVNDWNVKKLRTSEGRF
jgi:hypothetical protein